MVKYRTTWTAWFYKPISFPKILKKKNLRNTFVEEANNRTPHVSKTPTNNPRKEK